MTWGDIWQKKKVKGAETANVKNKWIRNEKIYDEKNLSGRDTSRVM